MSGEVIHSSGAAVVHRGAIEVGQETQAPSAPREEALIHDLEQQLAQTRQEAADLRQQLNQDSSTALEYAIKAENASKEAANAKCHLQELQDSIQRETHELKQLAQHLKEEVQGHRNEADKAKSDAEEAESQLQQLRENTQRETVVMQHLVQNLREEVAQAKSDAEKAKSDAEKAKSDAEKAQSTAEEAKSDVEKAKLDAEKLQDDIRAACVPGLSACIHGCSPLILGIEAQDDAKAYGDATAEFTELIAKHKALEAYRIGRMHISEPSSTSSSVPVSAKVSVQNDGEVPWPHTTVLASIEGDSMNLPIMVIGALEVGQAKEIEMDLSVSPTQGADSMLRSQMKSVWTVTDAATGARFGPLLIFEATWNLD
jgi:myosin heavy subunit